MAIELKVPAVGESITEVVIGEWLKAVGDWVEVDESIVVIETDKATVELPAPVSGTLSKILKQEGEEAAVDEVIGELEAGEKPAAVPAEGAPAEASPAEAAPADGGGTAASEAPAAGGHVMPAAARALADAGLEASQVTATGPGGRLLKEDVLRAQEAGAQKSGARIEAPPQAAPAAPPGSNLPGSNLPGSNLPGSNLPGSAPPASSGGAREEEVVRMTTLRKRIAERLVQAQQDAAMLTTFNEVDMSAVMALRRHHKEAFLKKHGTKLGFMSFFIKAVIEGLKEVPGLNAQIRDGNIVYRNYYDIGVAVGGGRGLVVPVIRNAERLSFAGVEATISDLATRARDNKLTLDELQGGTFTISNGGIYGSMLSTPILNPPQSGILGMHNIKDRPVAVDGEVVIRPIMYLALSYDHRVVDGREAVTFLVRVKDCIEEPARMLVEV